MGFLNSLVYNVVFMAAATGWFVAQILKTIIYALINKTFDAECPVPIPQPSVPSPRRPVSNTGAAASSLPFQPSWLLSSCMMPAVSAAKPESRPRSLTK